MRFVSFDEQGKARLGVQVGQQVIDLKKVHTVFPLAMPAADVLDSIEKLINAGQRGLDHAKTLTEAALGEPERVEQAIHAVDDVRLLAPITQPEKIIAVGLNYVDHVAESNMEIPKEPLFFTKFNSAITGPGAPVYCWRETEQLDYEVEFVAIIGKEGRDIPKEDALSYVFGYTIANDVSARDLQFRDSQWVKGKTLDTFFPIGPSIVTRDEIEDPQNLNISLTLNGETMQNSNTRHMIFDTATLISFLSTLFTLKPGDLISTGTPPGVGLGRNPQVFMKPGDVMVAEIQGIGRLENPIVADPRQS